MDNTNKTVVYNDLQDIKRRKEEVLAGIRKDNGKINDLWKGIFKAQEPKGKSQTIMSFVNTGLGMVDGFLFAWKLYKKFKR